MGGTGQGKIRLDFLLQDRTKVPSPLQSSREISSHYHRKFLLVSQTTLMGVGVGGEGVNLLRIPNDMYFQAEVTLRLRF